MDQTERLGAAIVLSVSVLAIGVCAVHAHDKAKAREAFAACVQAGHARQDCLPRRQTAVADPGIGGDIAVGMAVGSSLVAIGNLRR